MRNVQRLSARSTLKRVEAPRTVKVMIQSGLHRNMQQFARTDQEVAILIEHNDVKVLKGIEQRRDINKSLYKNEAKSTSEPRKAAKLLTYITNGDSPADMSFSNGTGSDSCDLTGTAASLTLAKIDAAMLAAYSDGGSPSMLLMSPTNKQNFSGLSSGSVSTNQITYTAPREAAIIGSVSLYLSDFGELAVTVDRNCPNSEMYLIDTDYVCIGHLPGRMFSVSDVAPVGDATRFAIVSEYTLIVKAPKSHAAVIGLDGT